jgi:hypothetical protein
MLFHQDLSRASGVDAPGVDAACKCDAVCRFRDFTFDRERYPEHHLREFVDR